MTGPSALTVLCCRPDGDPARPFGDLLVQCTDLPVHWVGHRPGKQIDPLLTGRLLVLGEDADLAAVVLRVLRRDLLGEVEVAYAAAGRSAFVDLWDLPRGGRAVTAARMAPVTPVPLVRDDAGGVLLARGELTPVNGIVYVDAQCVLRGAAERVTVRPDRAKGLAVTVTQRRLAGLRRQSTTLGRAVQIAATPPTTVTGDGNTYPRPMDRWTYYLHTVPLLLVGAST